MIGASSSWALYGLCGGHVYNQNGEPQDSAYVQGTNCSGVFLSTYSNYTGLYGLNDTSPPPSGTYYYCADKSGVGHAQTSIYHTQGTADTWDAYLSGSSRPCDPCLDRGGGP